MPEPAPEPAAAKPVPSVLEQMAAAAAAAAEDDWVPPPPPGGKPPPPPSPPPLPDLDLDPPDLAPPPPRITGFDDDLLDRELDRPPLHPPLDEPLSHAGEEDPDEALNRRRARLAEAGVQRPPSKPKKPRSWAWLGWLLLFALLGGVIGGGYEKRVELVAFYPPLAKLYEQLGIPVEAAEWLGLELHNLKSSTVLDAGQTRVTVSGEVANVGGEERILPAIRIAMRGANGQDLGAFTIKLEQGTIAAGEKLSFNAQLPAPKDEVTDLEVAFASQPVP
ncbi:MAG: FxLYD domain-containing protein [Ferrovibrio sp.]|uniref:FxLYD domain-containing protein n=1 Tax=Ferrovibrio sp. TaxID=1917215 RepID=UPI0026233571|nr:FxLYD domain-containing protein [Ferrovibrio sp.]MCW0236024.1 FxLYD domain-containing protein [Ferrovibrio sp.]